MFEYLASVIPNAGMAKGMAQYNLQLTLKAAGFPFVEALTYRLLVFTRE